MSSVLLVEDDENHASLFIRSFEEMNMGRIYWVSDGEQALDFLLHRGRYVDSSISPRPDLILLDLRLPRMDGMDLLKEIKRSEDLRSIPVVILTTSKNRHDIRNAYMNHANSYLIKPLGFNKFQELARTVCTYWLTWNTLPPGNDAPNKSAAENASLA
ncbi:MAG: response regulator [Methanothrix sp.]|jgi:CheY-like chemotaxis protein|uniref:response regulator n=1 Tax=Methanothrix sp. TaxID=90426 RepID=UPI00247D3AFF|nr:response regulator [Methanothrix sp.]